MQNIGACKVCGCEINEGTEHVSLSYQRETLHGSVSTVAWAAVIHVYCVECAKTLSFFDAEVPTRKPETVYPAELEQALREAFEG